MGFLSNPALRNVLVPELNLIKLSKMAQYCMSLITVALDMIIVEWSVAFLCLATILVSLQAVDPRRCCILSLKPRMRCGSIDTQRCHWKSTLADVHHWGERVPRLLEWTSL